MANSQITKEEIEDLIKVPGKTRGQVFITDFEYLKERKGEKGVVLLKKKLEELGNPIDYEKIKTMEWYPVGLRAVSLLIIKEVFGWGDKEIQDMGNSAPKYSFIIRLLMKYFLSLSKTIKESPKYWKKHYSIGKLTVGAIEEEKKYASVRLYDFKVHPIICTYLMENGYFMRIVQYVIKGKNFSSQETKCMFRGDPYHECLVKWE